MPAPQAAAAPDDDRTRRRAFARAHIRDAQRHGPLPTYGTDTWHALPYADPRRWAALILAAECWADTGDRLPHQAAYEIEHAAAVEQENQRWWAAVRKNIQRSTMGRRYTHPGYVPGQKLPPWRTAP